MSALSCALALLSGVIGAGFASGREIAHFFSSHGAYAPLSMLLACLTLAALFCRLPAQMERASVRTLDGLCRVRFGNRLGRVCAALFFLLAAVTGGAMLAACGELTALLLPVRPAYELGLCFALVLGTLLAARGLQGLALPGALLCVILPILMVKLLQQPSGEACFAPASHVVRAGANGIVYGALNAAMLAGMSGLLLGRSPKERRKAALLFALLFGALLALSVAALSHHRQAAFSQALPFVALCQMLGRRGYVLCALSMFCAAFSTLCAMLAGMMRMLPPKRRMLLSSGCCLLFALCGFGTLVERGYPVLGALCAALLGLLCLPLHQVSSFCK